MTAHVAAWHDLEHDLVGLLWISGFKSEIQIVVPELSCKLDLEIQTRVRRSPACIGQMSMTTHACRPKSSTKKLAQKLRPAAARAQLENSRAASASCTPLEVDRSTYCS